MKQILLLISFTLLVGCAQPVSSNVPSMNSLSLKLAQYDDENQVIKKIGYSPTKVELSSCGPARDIPCRIMYYKWGGKTLMIILVKSSVVTSFKVSIDQLPKDPNLINSSNANIDYMWLVQSWSIFDF